MPIAAHATTPRPRADHLLDLGALERRVLAGDPAAFERYVRAVGPRLFRFARARAGSDAAAEDVCQESWLRLHRCLARLAPDSALWSYLLGIARRVVIDRFRRAGRRPATTHDDGEVAALPAPGPSVARLAAHRRLIARALRRPDNVNPDAWQAYRWHDLDGLTMDAIAERQGINARTAATRVFYARRRLRAALAGDGRTPDDGPPTVGGI